jgi:hypothetical protein
MQKEFAVGLCCLLAFTFPVVGQGDPSTEVCNIAFSRGIRDNWVLLTEREQFEAYQDRLCRVRFSSYDSFNSTSAGLGVDVPLAEALIGLTGSFEEKRSMFSVQYDRFCRATYFESSDHQKFQSYISRISSALTSSWNRCQELHLQAYLQSKGVFTSVSPVGNLDGFVARVIVRNEFTGDVEISALHPEGQVQCTRGGAPVVPGVTKINIKDFSLTCSKNPSVEIPFAIETNFGQPSPIRIPGNVSRIAELAGQVERLRSDLATLGAQTNTLSTNLSTLSSEMVRECRICFEEIEGSGQCQGNRNTCSEWSKTPDWTLPFRDDTDNNSGGCTYRWRLECR